MFESDDFDQVLSQFELPEELEKCVRKVQKKSLANDNVALSSKTTNITDTMNTNDLQSNISRETLVFHTPNSLEANNITSPKHTKRKIITTHFDRENKRKFPGPAGLLTGSLEHDNDDSIGQIELLSQDIDYSHQNNIHGDLFQSQFWNRLLSDLKDGNLGNVDSIKSIKQQALAGNLRRRKANIVTALVESIDRSGSDPQVTVRDKTGNIKSTLHRDAWSAFSEYIVSEYCAIVLWKPTVLTTGSAYKKHYLNITLNNIIAIYSSTLLEVENEKPLPEGFKKKIEDGLTIIKTENLTEKFNTNKTLNELATEDLLDGLDNVFSDDVF